MNGETRSTAAGAAALGLCSALVAWSCARGGPELQHPVGETTASGAPLVRASSGETADREREHGGEHEDVGVLVTPPVREACRMPTTADTAPRFGVDSAALRPRGEDILETVAHCVAIGPLAGHKVRIVGHTDPRGSDEYNLQLGLYRAQAAKNHLIELGVPETAIEVESRGERQANGTTESGWALDRRVEVHLSETASTPPDGAAPTETSPAPTRADPAVGADEADQPPP